MGRSWRWQTGENRFSVECSDAGITWHTYKYDEHRGDYEDVGQSQTVAAFLQQGPSLPAPPAIVSEMKAHLGSAAGGKTPGGAGAA